MNSVTDRQNIYLSSINAIVFLTDRWFMRSSILFGYSQTVDLSLTLKAWTFSQIRANPAANIDTAAGRCTSATGSRDYG